jgi:hypothetical protein
MELRRALSVSHDGVYKDMRRQVRCPNCWCDNLVVTVKIYKCTSCELEWPRVRQRRKSQKKRLELVPS